MRLRKRWLVGMLVALLVSCVTVNIYFPAAAIQKAADQIVEDVRKTPEEKPQPTPEQTPEQKKDKGSRLLQRWLIGLGPTAAYAAVDVNVSTPAIRAVRASMTSRFPQLQPFYGKGAVGETNNGYLALRDTAALSLKERADLTRLVEQENADRRTLYTEIIRANNLAANSLPEVEKLFANSWRDKSSPGWWIQQDGGQWVKK